jgi:hypothetical protein
MRFVERCCLAVRHSRWLAGSEWLWTLARPTYDRLVAMVDRGGLKRIINSTDCVFVLPSLRHVTEHYEAEVWSHLMAEVRSDDVVADVDAHIGLYTVTLARGPTREKWWRSSRIQEASAR